MATVVTFEDQPPEGFINFGLGQPSAELLSIELMKQASEAFFAVAEPHDLNYGLLAGDGRYLEYLANFLSKHYDVPVDPKTLFATAGNSQALDMLCGHLAKPGDTVVVEEPCYFLAYQIFKDHGLNIISVPMDGDGIDMNALERVLAENSVQMVYTIPAFQNPSGVTMTLERRKKMVELSNDYDFLILADEVYHLLSFYDAPPPAFGTMVDNKNVISVCSFSKIVAPGLRLGWIQTHPDRVKRLTQVGCVNSGGALNHYTSHLIGHAMDKGLLDKQLNFLCDVYRRRVDAMDEALTEHFTGLATWTKPQGGYFFWIEFPEGTDVPALREKGKAADVGFLPGNMFSSCGAMTNALRMSFAFFDVDDIKEGVRRIRTLFD